jgi:hypothetical protein
LGARERLHEIKTCANSLFSCLCITNVKSQERDILDHMQVKKLGFLMDQLMLDFSQLQHDGAFAAEAAVAEGVAIPSPALQDSLPRQRLDREISIRGQSVPATAFHSDSLGLMDAIRNRPGESIKITVRLSSCPEAMRVTAIRAD